MQYDVLKLENQLCFPLYAYSKEVVKKYKPFLDAIGLTYTQYIVMLVLWEQERMTAKELGEQLYLDSGTLTPVLKRLESEELITRMRSEEDERHLVVTLTKKGVLLKQKAVNVPLQVRQCINLSDEDAMSLYVLLHKALSSI